jgi:hypothetical protein
MFLKTGKMNFNIFVVPSKWDPVSRYTFENYEEAYNFYLTMVWCGALPPQRHGDYLNKAALEGMYYRVRAEFEMLKQDASNDLVACRDYVMNEWMT